MIKELIPLQVFVSFLLAVYTLVQVIKLDNKEKIIPNKKQPIYHWSDSFGIIRGYLGVIAIWMIYLLGAWI